MNAWIIKKIMRQAYNHRNLNEDSCWGKCSWVVKLNAFSPKSAAKSTTRLSLLNGTKHSLTFHWIKINKKSIDTFPVRISNWFSFNLQLFLSFKNNNNKKHFYSISVVWQQCFRLFVFITLSWHILTVVSSKMRTPTPCGLFLPDLTFFIT